MDFDAAAQTKSGPAHMTDEQRWDLVKDGNLYSENMMIAKTNIKSLNNPLITQTFDNISFSVLGGNDTDMSDNQGFGLRNTLGSRINQAIGEKDISRLEQLGNKDYDISFENITPVLRAQLDGLIMGLKMNAQMEGIKLKTLADIPKEDLLPKNDH